MVKILLHGLSGPVDGKEYPSVMPSLGANPDEWVASVVNYVRYEFGNAGRRFRRQGDTTSPFVSTAEVANIRKQNADRVALWTLEELENNTQAVAVNTPVNTNNDPAVKTVAGPSTGNSSAAGSKPVAKTTTKKTTPAPKKVTYASVQPLLLKNTCLTCHNQDNKLIGPSYKEIARKKYSVAQIVQLIKKPNPKNWPGYATAMPPMAHVPTAELTQIATWIKSLETAK
jgi:cytochrome c551/c552